MGHPVFTKRTFEFRLEHDLQAYLMQMTRYTKTTPIIRVLFLIQYVLEDSSWSDYINKYKISILL